MDMVNIKINGVPCEVPANATILEAAREAGIDIPTPVSYTHLDVYKRQGTYG